MGWTVIVPLKAEPLRKSRLSAAIDAASRVTLSEQLYRHVVGCVSQSALAATIVVLSPSEPPADVPVRWWPEEGGGVNAEFSRIRAAIPGPVMVVNADLPLLDAADLVALATAAEAAGCAIAPDRHGLGTNAVAVLPGVAFAFAFGPGSLRAHSEAAPGARLVERAGLAHDLDTVEDIEAVLRAGPLPADMARGLAERIWR